ncbi:MAG: bifunctional phosphoglucose/phosphomannose isomerase [Candidatus Cloacimonetes bacterium]|nr:bifunctional phosphoglucose/phosphomannose isomerase [Candidatus Cloacimonadota bacterium]
MEFLDELEQKPALDPEDMYHKIIHLPEQVMQAYQSAKIHGSETILASEVKLQQVVIAGMGGSAMAGDIARAAFGQKIPVSVVKDYELPYVDDKTLVLCLSYSGNTQETLSCFKQAIQKGCAIAAVTSGGKLRELCTGKYPWVELPDGLPPRSAIGYLFFGLLRLLESYTLIPDHSATVKSLVANLIRKAGAICRQNPLESNLAKSSAREIRGKIPVIYASCSQLYPLAYRWKCQFNENAKYPAFCHTLPEMNHNEIEGWEETELNKGLIVIILRHLQEAGVIGRRLQAFKKLLHRNSTPFLEFYVEGDKLIERIFSLIYLGDMISYYLALLQEVDPTRIDYIDYLKAALTGGIEND